MIVFNNWIISVTGLLAMQYDNLSRSLEVVGDIPDGYKWEMLVEADEYKDTIALKRTETGLRAVLTADNLSVAGMYGFQLRATLEADGVTQRHTNVVFAAVPKSLTGDGNWPEIPTAYQQYREDMITLASHPPIPGPNGYWLIWSLDYGVYEESTFPLPEVSAGGGTTDHDKLSNRDAADQHPMSAITGLEKALEKKSEFSGSWNDLTDKPFYSETTVEEVLPESQPAYSADDGIFIISEGAPVLVPGTEYTVSWNGVEYSCVAVDASSVAPGAVLLGDGSVWGLDATDDPFTIAAISGAMSIMPLDGTTELTISIWGQVETVHQIDPKYIPGAEDRKSIVIVIEKSSDGSTASSVASFADANALDADELQSVLRVNYGQGSTVRSLCAVNRVMKVEAAGAVAYIEFSFKPYNDLSYAVNNEELWRWKATGEIEKVQEFTMLPAYSNNDVGKVPTVSESDKLEYTDLPTALPTPNKLTFTGAVNAEFDGSEAVSVEIPSGGGGTITEEVITGAASATISIPVNCEVILTTDSETACTIGWGASDSDFYHASASFKAAKPVRLWNYGFVTCSHYCRSSDNLSYFGNRILSEAIKRSITVTMEETVTLRVVKIQH